MVNNNNNNNFLLSLQTGQSYFLDAGRRLLVEVVVILQPQQGDTELNLDTLLPDSLNSSHFAEAESCRG